MSEFIMKSSMAICRMSSQIRKAKSKLLNVTIVSKLLTVYVNVMAN